MNGWASRSAWSSSSTSPCTGTGTGCCAPPASCSRPRGQDKLIYAVNLALLFAMTLCIASGVMISRVALPQVGLFLNSNIFWNRLHILTAEITLYLVPVHAALRWRWIAAVGRRLLTRRTGGPGQGSR